MNYKWHIVTGWARFLRPDSLPYWIVLMFLYSLLVVRLAFSIFKLEKGEHSLLKIALRVFIISFCFFVLQSALSHVYTTLMRFYGPNNSLGRIWSSSGTSINEHDGSFNFTFVTVCICACLTYKANRRFTAKLINENNVDLGVAVLFISFFTSPLVFCYR